MLILIVPLSTSVKISASAAGVSFISSGFSPWSLIMRSTSFISQLETFLGSLPYALTVLS